MKHYLGFLALLFTSLSLAQTHYPLSPGNLWEYWDSDLFGYRTVALGDTLMPNGKRYTQFTASGVGADFVREENAKIYGYNGYSGLERLLYDFTANAGDTIAVLFSPYDTVVTVLEWIGFSEVLGKQCTVWNFAELWSRSTMYKYTSFADGIGPTDFQYEPGMHEYLKGAIIGGTLYGEVTGTAQTDPISLPKRALLKQNYPNPFNPTTEIQFTVVDRQLTIIKVFDVLGRDVATLVNEVKEPGTYTVEFDGSNLASGVYFYRLAAGDFVASKRIVLLK